MSGRRESLLSDEQVRAITSGLGQLPDSQVQGNEAYLVAFIRLAYSATGRLHGAGTYRSMLKAFGAPFSPSQSTVHAAKLKVESEIASGYSGLVATEGQADTRPYAARVARPDAGAARDPAISALAVQLSHQRARIQHLETECARMRSELAIAIQERRAAEAALLAVREIADQLLMRNGELGAALAQNARFSEGNRLFALYAIEQSRGEARLLKETLDSVQAKRVKEREMLEAYRRAASSGRAAE